MWLLFLAVLIQCIIIFEGLFSRILFIFFNSERSAIRKYADGACVAQGSNFIASILSIPVQVVGNFMQIMLSKLILLLFISMLCCVLFFLAKNDVVFFNMFVKMYNSGIGVTLNSLLIKPLEIFDLFFRFLVPIYNFIVHVSSQVLFRVIFPFIDDGSEHIPTFIENTSLMFGAITLSANTYFSRVVECMQFEKDQELQCVANANYMTIDLMTPGLYAKKGSLAFREIFRASCESASGTLDVLLYPLSDFVFWKALHISVNTLQHILIAIPIITNARCSIANSDAADGKIYSSFERKMMCSIDLQSMFTMMDVGIKSWGEFGDNWLNVLPVAFGFSDSCSSSSDVATSILAAGDFLDVSKPRNVVSLTKSLYAITDGHSVMYNDASEEGKVWSVYGWPFEINPDFGVAAVQTLSDDDTDGNGDRRTGMLGCACHDSTESGIGMQISCATIPFKEEVSESEEQYQRATIHTVKFEVSTSIKGMSCDTSLISVETLRFSRKRFSVGNKMRDWEYSDSSRFDVLERSGVKNTETLSADAAIYVRPLCSGNVGAGGSFACMRDVDNCFPFCLGLHSSGKGPQKIVMRNAMRWNDYVDISHTDCAVSLDEGGTCNSGENFDQNRDSTEIVTLSESFKSTCAFDVQRCASDDSVNSIVHVSKYDRQFLTQNITRMGGSVRLANEPFVIAGDIILSVDEEKNVMISRLYDNNRGDFTLKDEELSLVGNKKTTYNATCQNQNGVDDNSCYTQAVMNNQIILPSLYTMSLNRRIAVSSEWAVHWVSHGDAAVWAAEFNSCQGGAATFTVQIPASYRRARIWTLKTMRSGEVEEDERHSAYMRIPNWLEQNSPCDGIVNQRVQDLEFFDENNILVSVLAAAPRDYDWFNGRVLPGRDFTYRRYWLNPNKHDCIDEESDENIYTCWRHESEGQWIPENSQQVLVYGLQCRNMQKMPNVFGYFSALLRMVVNFFHIVYDVVMLATSAFVGGFKNIFFLRPNHITHHSILDTSGRRILNVDAIVHNIDEAKMHFSNSFIKVSNMLSISPGYEKNKVTIVGFSRMLFHAHSPETFYTGFVKQFPTMAMFKSIGAVMASSPLGSMPPFVFAIQRFTYFLTNNIKFNLKLARRFVIKLLQLTKTSTLSEVVSIIPTTIYESENDKTQTITNPINQFCVGFAQVFGYDNPLAQAVFHSCHTVPDLVDAVFGLVKILLTEYPNMACVCKLPRGTTVVETINDVCLRRFTPIDLRLWLLQISRYRDFSNTEDSVGSAESFASQYCFNTMDYVNSQLITLFDPLLSRIDKIASSSADVVDYLFIFFDVDAGNCDDFAASPYVVSLLPEPSSFFSSCMHSKDCEIRCLDTFNAFERTLASYSQVPVYKQRVDTYIDSMLFSANDVDEGKNLAPFVVYDLRELSDCAQICGPVVHKSNRCVVVAGVYLNKNSRGRQETFTNIQNIRVAYYCLPADITQSVYEYTNVQYNYTQDWPSNYVISEIFIASENEVKLNMGEMLLIYTRESGSRGNAKVSFCRGDAYTYTITETLDFAIDQTAIHEIKNVRFVLGPLVELFVSGTRVQEANFNFMTNATIYTSQKICEKLTIDVNSFARDGNANIPSIQKSTCSKLDAEESADFNISVCLQQQENSVGVCVSSVKLPMRGRGIEYHSTHGVKYYESSNKLTQELGIDPTVPVYITQDGQSVLNRRRVARTTTNFVLDQGNGENEASELKSFDVIIAGAFADSNTWIQILRLKLEGGRMNSMIAMSTQVETTVNMHLQCSISNCIGCQDSSGFTDRMEDLQSKCYAAQQCAVSRCVGTTVNMRKPLCNVGKVMAKSLDLFRVGLTGLWQVVSEMIIVTVELSENRREKYYITFPEQAFLGVVCNTKDTIVEASATFTSILGAVSHAGESTMARFDFDSTGSQVLDSRFHARFIMSTTSLTNLISSFLMAPVIAAVSAQQVINCMSNDIMVVFKNIFDSDSNLQIEFGTQDVRDSVEDVVGICMSDVVADDMKKIGYNNGMDKAISSIHQIAFQIIDIQQYSFFSVFAHAINGICTYAIGIVRSVMDLAQVIDWGKCKLPDVSSGFKADCVCGDKPVKAKRRMESGLWCTGPLLLTTIYGDDIVVWNPYTLEELTERMKSVDTEAFFDCLQSISSEDTTCTKPNLPEFAYQGVDAIQVITKCRENYQQKQWDAGALVLGTFEHKDWISGTVSSARISFSLTRDPTILLKQRLRSLSRRFTTSAVSNLHYEDWLCLQRAYENKKETKACLQEYLLRLDLTGDQYFEFVESEGGFLNTDSCWIFSGNVKQHNSLYNGSLSPAASSHIPVTELHTVAQNEAVRFRDAREKISKLQADIGATMSGHLKLPDDFTAEAYSQEGDEIHQFVDCMILGPYANADLQSAFEMANGEMIPVVKYYRAGKDSREFGTESSPARVHIMKLILDHLKQRVSDIVRLHAQNRINLIESQFFDESNLLCICKQVGLVTPPPSLACCLEASSFSDIQFKTQNLFEGLEDIKEDFISESLQEVIDSGIVKNIWTFNFENDHVLTTEQKLELADAYQFDFSKSVYEYSENDVNQYVFNVWKRCIQSLRAPFFVMPLKRNLADMGGSNEMNIDFENINFDPTKESGGEYLHGMEPIIEKMTRKMRQKSPFWWSHVHRYVPSRSVWCEDSERKQIDSDFINRSHANLHTTSTTSDLFSDSENTHNINTEHINTLSYVSGYKSACMCNWLTSQGCSVYRLRKKLTFQAHTEIGVEWESYKLDNPTLVYNDWHELFKIFKFIAYADNGDDPLIYPYCTGFNPSVAWGLLETDEYFDWYQGLSTEDKQFSVGVHKLATTGPAGLRLAHLTQMNEHTKKYVHFTKRLIASINFEYGHTVAQPVCAPDLQDVLTHDLRSHFKNVFFPMAHTVDESPLSAYCSRWAVEWALLVVLRDARGESDEVTALQQETEIVWRRRCKIELDNIGICALRGVYDLPPPHNYEVSCPFTLENLNMNRVLEPLLTDGVDVCTYVTENCLVRCGSNFYDPCFCGRCDDEHAHVCASGVVFRADTNSEWVTEKIKLKSLHWPEEFPEKEVGVSRETFMHVINTDLNLFDNHNDHALLEEIANLILSKDVGEGHPPDTSCDDLTDYFPADAQHPVGYHPTTSCLKSTTNMRGFDTWMSANGASDGAESANASWGIDPIRLRNMTAYTNEFGASHLVCDQSAYGAPSFSFNDLKISVHWSSMIAVDPAVPNIARQEVDVGLFENIARATSGSDTALSKDEFNEYDFFPHTTGLVRDWSKWHIVHDGDIEELSNEEISQVDDLWPHWNTARRDAYGIDDYETLQGCSLPPLKRCLSNSDCAEDSGMVCKMADSSASPVSGICVKVESCFRHEHCTQGNQLCSGDGICVDADVFFYNRARRDVFLQMFSERCDYSTYGASEFENVPDFLTSNGLCSHRSWHDYKNITHFSNSVSGLKNIIEAKDRIISRSAWSEDVSMSDMGLMKQYPHACDTTLLHSEYKICKHDSPQDADSADNLYFLKTWSQKKEGDDLNSIYFCDFQSDYLVNGFLKPYTYGSEGVLDGTLKHVPETIRRCVDFEICPQISFVVDSQRVQSRKIIPVEYSMLEETAIFRQELNVFHKKYTFSDSEKCWGVGYKSTILSDPLTTICVVDRYTLPILNVVLQNDVDSMQIVNFDASVLLDERIERSWKYLRSDKRCPDAFGNDFPLFKSTIRKLVRPYYESDREEITQHANLLLLKMFGMDDSSSDRGFSSIAEYEKLATCASYVLQKLNDFRDHIEQTHTVYPFDNIIGTETGQQDGVVNTDLNPGMSLYMFHERGNVFVPFMWIWRCVILSTNEEGGAADNWFQRISNVEQSIPRSLECDIYDKNRVEINDEITVKEYLQYSESIFLVDDKSSDAAVQIKDIETAISATIQSLGLTSTPILDCIKDELLGCYSYSLSTCSEKTNSIFGPIEQSAEYRLDAYEVDEYNLYERVYTRLFGDTTSQYELSQKQMLERNILIETSLHQTISKNATFIPYLKFANLQNLERNNEIKHLIIQNPDAGVIEALYTDDQVLTYATSAGVQGNEHCKWFLKKMEFQFFKGTEKHYMTPDDALFKLLSNLEHFLYAMPSFTLGNIYKDPVVSALLQSTVNLYGDSVFNKPSVYSVYEWNLFMKSKGFECPANNDGLNVERRTNTLHSSIEQCYNSLKTNVGVKVKRNADYKLSTTDSSVRDILMGGFYPHAHENTNQDTFLKNITSRNWIYNSYSSLNDHICFTNNDYIEVINPYLATNYDIVSGCDVSTVDNQLIIDVGCARRQGVACSEMFSDYTNEVKYDMPATCVQSDQQLVFRRNTGSLRNQHSRFCDMKPNREDVCTRKRGGLHGAQGVSVDSLYEKKAVTHLQAGMWKKSNSIFYTDRRMRFTPDMIPALQIVESDIGGHKLDFEVEESRSTLNIWLSGIHLSADANNYAFVKANTRWMQSIESHFAVEQAFHESKMAVPSEQLNWKCPLSWVTMYSGFTNRSLCARTPSAYRNEFRFSHITNQYKYAHPTVSSINAINNLRHSKFMSEWLVCTSFDVNACRGKDHLKDTITKSYKQVLTLVQEATQETCSCVFDWPNTVYTLRDGSKKSSEQCEEFCNIFNRLPPFAIELVRSEDVASDVWQNMAKSTQSASSACHMGRLKKIRTNEAVDKLRIQFCREHTKDAKNALLCRILKKNNHTELGQFLTDHVQFELETAHVPVRREGGDRSRRKCNSCEDHQPHFFVESSGNYVKLNSSSPQLSVGMPVKFSTERHVAGTLRNLLCPSAAMELADCLNLNNMHLEWEKNKFLSGLLHQAADYSKNLSEISASGHSGTGVPGVYKTYEEYLEDEKLLWDREWVFCGYSTLTGLKTCHGSIPKEDWTDNNLRQDLCREKVEQGSATVGVQVPILFCLLDPKITTLCQKVADWNYEIKSILCKASGICPQTGFFYNPSSYYLSNQEFVHDTVSEYYSSVSDIGSTCTKTNTDDQIRLNVALKSKCASSKIAPLYDALIQIRRGLYLVVRALFYLLQLFVTLIQIVASAATGAVTEIESLSAKLLNYFRALLVVAADAFITINQAMYELIFERGIGKQVMDFIYSVCESINFLYDLIVVQGICVALEWIAGILESIGIEIVSISEVKINLQFTSIYPLSFLTGPGTAIVNAAETLASQSWCVAQDILTCKFETDRQETEFDATLPVATRCFSTYTPFLGDTQQLSCTKADTCHMSSLDQTRVVCAACPDSDLVTRRQFGCDVNTKICTCNVERAVRTPCLSNRECQTAQTCNYVDTSFELMSSTVPCRACMNEQFCFIQPSNDIGYCACSLLQTKSAQCEQENLGRNVMLPPSLCLFQESDRTTQMSSSFLVHTGELMTASCMMADPSSSFCMFSSDLDDFFIVTTSLPRTSRRLLVVSSSGSSPESSTGDEMGFRTFQPLCRDALASSVLIETKAQCEQKILKSRMTVAMLQLQIPECTFCSYEDFLHTFNTRLPTLLLNMNVRKAALVVTRHSTIGHIYENALIFWRHVQMEISNLHNANLSNVLEINYENNFFRVFSKDNTRITPTTAHALEIVINLFPERHKNISKYHDIRNRKTVIISNVSYTHMSRNLLQDQSIMDSIQSMIELHSDYSEQISNSFQYKFTDLVNSMNTDWLLAPLEGRNQGISCDVAFNLLQTISESLQTTVLYYRFGFVSSPSPTLKWPSLSSSEPVSNIELDSGEVSFIGWLFEEFSTFVGFDEHDVVYVVNETMQSFSSSMKCDFEAIQTCSKWNHHLYHSFIVVFAYFSIIILIMVSLQFHLVSVFVGVVFFNAILWYSYSYSWSCTPLIPVCFLKDFAYSFKQIFPIYFEFPNSLLQSTTSCRQIFCNGDTSTSTTCIQKHTLPSSCYLSCSQIGFQDWESTTSVLLAWLNLVDFTKKIIPSIPFNLDSFETQLNNKEALLISNQDGSNQDLVNANYICTFLNIYQIAPPTLLLYLIINTVIVTLQSLSLLLFSTLNFILSWVVSIFTH